MLGDPMPDEVITVIKTTTMQPKALHILAIRDAAIRNDKEELKEKSAAYRIEKIRSGYLNTSHLRREIRALKANIRTSETDRLVFIERFSTEVDV